MSEAQSSAGHREGLLRLRVMKRLIEVMRRREKVSNVEKTKVGK